MTTSDVAHPRKQPDAHLKSAVSHKSIPPTGSPPVVFAYTRQGASHKSMDLGLFHHSPTFRQWHSLTNDELSLVGGDDVKPIVTAQMLFGHAGDYLSSWVPMRHLEQGRIDALKQMAETGVATRFSHGMPYLFFANNLAGC